MYRHTLTVKSFLLLIVSTALTGCGIAPGGCQGAPGSVAGKALNYNGSLNGSASKVSSTDAQPNSTSTTGRAKRSDQAAAPGFDAKAIGWFEDLLGNRLRDFAGNEYPKFPVAADGAFNVSNLPVGVDIVLKIDTNGDGKADLETILNIPKNPDADNGALDRALSDPLSTLILAKLRKLAALHGVNLDNIRVSLSGLVHRIRDAYEHLYEGSGIDQALLLDQLNNMSDEQLAKLFADLLPMSAQRGMQMADGSIALVTAKEVNEVVVAAAKILVQGGFVIADEPGGADLSVLAGLPNVTTMGFQDFFSQNGPGGGAGAPVPPPAGQPMPAMTLYMSQVAEPDRNFSNNEDENRMRRHSGPVFHEHVLQRMAKLYLGNKTVTLRNLYYLLVSLDTGMGVRLSYSRWSGPNQPRVDVFEAPGGGGIEMNTQQLFTQLGGLGMGNPDPALFEQTQQRLRQIIRDFLAGTAEPAFERLFAGILQDRIGSAEAFARKIRDARAHLPFSRSGPATFFVLATADSFRNANARPVTVNIESGDGGRVTRATYDSGGNGKFYVGFGPMVGDSMNVSFINRRTGRPMHDEKGQRIEVGISDESVFAPVDGRRFADAFSESGVNYPGRPALRMPNPGFDPNRPPDPQTNPPVFEAFVLVSNPGPDGTPIRVEYAGGTTTYNPQGRYYMQFVPETHTQGKFALITEGGEVLCATPGDPSTRILVLASAVQGRNLAPITFRHYFGVDAPNLGYDASGDPYFDDINNNNLPDAGEPTFSHREFLFNPGDWRSTRVEYYYRRADNNGFPAKNDIAFESPTPRTRSGVELVARNIKPRLNAFRFGRPNVTINLLAAFSPPEFFNGTASINAETRVNPFTALAILNLVFDSIHNVKANVDWDGPGPMPMHEEFIEAHTFTIPIGDPVQMITTGFEKVAN